MLDVIIRKTYGFGKKDDHISTSQFQAATGMSKGSIHRARKKLLEMNIIGVSKKGYTSVLMYSIQKNYKNWRVYPKKDTVSQKATGCIPKSNRVYPKKHTKCIPKSGTQKKERNSTKETLTKERENVLERGFEEFWNRYGKKGNRARALKHWIGLPTIDKVNIIDRVDGYVGSTPEKRFRKDAEKWINPANRHWEDEIVGNGGTGNGFMDLAAQRAVEAAVWDIRESGHVTLFEESK